MGFINLKELAELGEQVALGQPVPPAEPSRTAPDSGRPRDSGVPIALRGLGKAYGARTVLSSIDLDVAAGEFVAIVGRSGCGKSTLLRLLAGLEAPSQGSIALDGQALRDTHDELRLMFQDARLLPWKSVADNVALGLPGSARERREAALAALADVGLADRADEWPARLSGGQRQRVALARALVHKPRLLLLDEPLGALDALTRIEMHALIERLWREQGFTALLVTHDVAEAIALADRVLLIEDGSTALDLRIALERPRDRTSAGFTALEDRVLRRVLRHPPLEEAHAPAAAAAPFIQWRWAA
ncbi:ATP-binding cassette domain-containing protein [Thauera sp. Sel9]|uniref:ATP-binding cassette domain-containing protein n=1 Tax=Thauera sp. Sel9 TaxID=2974299 RepID=UPI0021E1950B|nr:ATP-binding cassette domain-containing protein [Thauera sp. Sel9]MCV2217074.1 ATP-binding cassette domain-containing protein [Thauera sp. Sel9]